MSRYYDGEILEMLVHHAKNLIRISSVPPSPEVQEFRKYLRRQLLGAGVDIGVLLRDLQEETLKRVEGSEQRDPVIREYYRAVYMEISFLLSAIPNDPDAGTQFGRGSAFPASSEAA